MKNKKIFFRPSSKNAEELLTPPEPAKKFIPEWWKKIPLYSDNDKEFKIKEYGPNKTLKFCLPFLDSMSNGYMLTFPSDVYCTRENGFREIKWLTKSFSLFEQTNFEQIKEYPMPDGYEKETFQLKYQWGIQTPPGYSLLYMHPLGRFDLPFYTLHAVIDSDKHYIPMTPNIIFKENFEGIIKKGTPFAQVIPIKRDNWVSESKKFLEDGYDPNKILAQRDLFFSGWYKKNIWSRKEYN